MNKKQWTFALPLALALSACGSDDGDDTIEIAGSWSSDFGDENIDSEVWGGTTVVTFDNADNFAVTQNPADAEFDAEKFNRIVWTEPTGDGFYYCWIDFGLDDAEAAMESTSTADDSDPASGGCGDFPWTKLSPKE